MCKTPCGDLRCSLYCGPIVHEGVCNPSIGKTDVEYIECCNTDTVRRALNVSTGPMHIRVLNFCPPVMTECQAGYFDPPQCSQNF
jgi:hypothetical protein